MNKKLYSVVNIFVKLKKEDYEKIIFTRSNCNGCHHCQRTGRYLFRWWYQLVEKHVDSVNGFEIGVKPGLAVKLNDNFSFITKVGFAGYRDDYYRGEENGFGVGLDGENISIGIEYEF